MSNGDKAESEFIGNVTSAHLANAQKILHYDNKLLMAALFFHFVFIFIIYSKYVFGYKIQYILWKKKLPPFPARWWHSQ